MVMVKICGLKDPDLVAFAAREGADWIGFMFPVSPRQVTLAAAQTLLLSVGKAAELLQQTDRLIKTIPEVASVYGKDAQRLPFDFPEVLAAIAPRSLYIHAPQDDSNFKVASARRCVESASEVYRILGAKEELVAVYPPGPHGYPIEEREKSYDFIDRVLETKQ